MGILDIFKGKYNFNEYAISLDIGTEFVKTLIFKIEKDKARVLGVGRQRQRLADIQGGVVTDIYGVIRNCEAALEQAATQAKIMPEQVIIGIAGELVKGITTDVKYIRPDQNAKINMDELTEIVNRIQKHTYERARKILAYETGHREVNVKLVNSAVVDVKIDGYHVTNPLGFQGKEMEVSVFNAFAPNVHLGALQTIAESLDLDLLSIAAEPFAVARCMGSDQESDFSAIFIDIGGGTTDIAVVSKGGLVGTKMFALGGRAFTKRVSSVLGEPFLEAEQDKLNYSAGKLPDDKKTIVEKAIKQDCEVWLSGVQLTLEEFSDLELLPSKIMLCGGGSNLPDIERVLNEAKWGRNVPFAKKPTVSFLRPKNISSIIDDTNELTEISDVTPMALANLAIDVVGNEGVVEGLFSKIVMTLRN
ncbi:MAG: rod shape-determining protein [Candidatus Berkelbacteria bacterium]|nr:rod shape-determining protein [Candidatus Berkelbacteria bacterium]